MKAQYIDEASKMISEPQVLINMVSRRVRQLNAGNRPLIDVDPGTGLADIALQEITQGKVIVAPELTEVVI
jgi:DNA-directed RNA polymerase subunit omega